MFKYTRFDIINNSKKFKYIIKFIINIIIISFILIILFLNITAKEDVKLISSNSRRIINTLNNYTETMSDFMVSNINLNEINVINQIDEIKNIRLSIDYFKGLKQTEIKQQELKEQKLKEQELKQQKLKEQEFKQKEINNKKKKAINLIKSYIPNYDELIKLTSSHIEILGYSNNNNCLKKLIKINNEELFNNLIKIDYENNKVSFNYLDILNEEYYKNTDNIITSHLYTDYDTNNIYYNYSHYIYKNYNENIIKNPIYQIIKEQLEIDYLYKEPNLTDEYNNKSKYFQQNLNDFMNYYLTYNGWEKYYETYENDIYYLYNKHFMNHYDIYNNFEYADYYYNEFLIENKIIINNQNPIQIYNKYSYKFKCNIPSRTINNYPSINIHNYNSFSMYGNWCYGYPGGCIYSIYKNNIEETLNLNLNDYISRGYYRYSNKGYVIDPFNSNYYYYSSNINNELDKNKGTRMVKHNITNNFPEYLSQKDWVRIRNYYFIETVNIDFPLIEIYNEYDYIKKIISSISDIYNLPIIPPIKYI